jgi:hypothetical protein
VAAKKKSQKKASSLSTRRRLTKTEQHKAIHGDVIKDIERLEVDLKLDLTELKQKLNCFCMKHVPLCPTYPIFKGE